MIFLNNINESLVIIFFYMFIYNISLFVFFWTLLQFTSFKLNTLNNLTDLKSNQFFLIVFTILFLSIAGIPPFLGFFSKILILVNLLNTNFFFFFIFFFILLFFALYFYLQNIRFLYSTTKSKINYFFFQNIYISHFYILFTLFFLVILTFSFLSFDELFIFFTWLLL